MDEIAAIIISRNGESKIGEAVCSVKKWVPAVHVFVDITTTDRTAAEAARHGATVHAIQTSGCVEVALAEAHYVPGTRFILRLDDDERFVLPDDIDPIMHRQFVLGQMKSENATQVGFYRRWLLPGQTHYISCAPWFPDTQLRLTDLQNSTIVWPRRPHESIKFHGSILYDSNAFIDHLDFCFSSTEERKRKSASYVERNPTTAGSEMYYCYENHELTICPKHKLLPPLRPNQYQKGA